MSYFKGFGNGSNSNGQFWYGRTQQIPPELIPSNVHPGLAKILPLGFPGFLFKKNTDLRIDVSSRTKFKILESEILHFSITKPVW